MFVWACSLFFLLTVAAGRRAGRADREREREREVERLRGAERVCESRCVRAGEREILVGGGLHDRDLVLVQARRGRWGGWERREEAEEGGGRRHRE